ncbi:MAG: glycosyltransferase, partial [Planctomycetota bacterium]
GLGDEATAVLRSVDELVPVVLYVDESYVGVSKEIHRKHVENCLSADAIVANSAAVKKRLESITEMPPIRMIEPAVQPYAPAQRQVIRHAISNAHSILRIQNEQPLAISICQFGDDCGLVEIIEAWPKVIEDHPDAKLWLVGEGPCADQIWQRIVDLGLSYSVLLPGYFDALNDLFSAADLYIHTGGTTQSGDGLVRASLTGIRSVAIRNWVTEDLSERNPRFSVTLTERTKLAESVSHAFNQAVQNLDNRNPGPQNHSQAKLSCRRQIEDYLKLLEIHHRQITRLTH